MLYIEHSSHLALSVVLYCVTSRRGIWRNINDNMTDAVTWASEKPQNEVDCVLYFDYSSYKKKKKMSRAFKYSEYEKH